MIRLILIALFLIIVFLISIIIWPINWIIGKFNKKTKDILSLRFVQGVFKVILFISGVRTTVIGKENLIKDEPVVYIGNHKGFYDVIVSYSMLPSLTGYIAKDSLTKVPFIRVWMKLLYCLFINRKNPREGIKTILKGIEHLKAGISIFIFPEGTRNKGEGLLDFHSGSFKLATKTNCKIIPVVQNNTENVLETHFPRIKRTHTVIEFCEPIDITKLSTDDQKNIHTYVHNIVSEKYEHNKSLV